MSTEPLCSDPLCPCRDGLACHYRDAADGTAAIPPTPKPEAEQGDELVQAALNALDLLMFYRDSWAKDCVDPECGEWHRLRPLQLIIDDLHNALTATEEKG